MQPVWRRSGLRQSVSYAGHRMDRRACPGLAGGIRRGARSARPADDRRCHPIMTSRHHVIVGAGTAGFNAIGTLAELEGQPLNVTLVSAELPYARMVLPYYLSSEIQRDNVFTISEERLASLGVKLMLGRAAAGLDRSAKRLLLDDGTSVGYDDLLIATGSSATRPPLRGIDGARIFDHWTLAHTDAIRPELQPGRHAVLIGGGFIAFTLVNPLLATGVRLTVVERESHILPRMLN